MIVLVGVLVHINTPKRVGRVVGNIALDHVVVVNIVLYHVVVNMLHKAQKYLLYNF